MTAAMLYCSNCRDRYGHQITRGKYGPDIFRRVTVTGRHRDDSYQCRCHGCDHTWRPSSPEVAELFSRGVAL